MTPRLREISDYGWIEFSMVLAKRASPSGRQRRGRCQQIWRSRFDPNEIYVVQEFRRATGRPKRFFSRTNWSRNFARTRNSSRLANRCAMRFPARRSTRSKRDIHFSIGKQSFLPPISSPWIPAPAPSISRPGHGEDDYNLGRAEQIADSIAGRRSRPFH